MLDQYKIDGPTAKIEIEIEQDVIRLIRAMEAHKKFSFSEITNTALKRFISQHSDFLPFEKKAPKS